MSQQNQGGLTFDQLLRAATVKEMAETNQKVHTIKRAVLFGLGFLVVFVSCFTWVPFLLAKEAIKAPEWGNVSGNIDAARKYNSAMLTTFPYSGWQVAMCLTGLFPGLYTSIFFGSGDRGLFPLLVYYSSISDAQSDGGKTMAELSREPEKFAEFLQALETAVTSSTSFTGESREMAIVCNAWAAAKENFSVCKPPTIPAKKCKGGDVLTSAAQGGLMGALGGAAAGGPIGFLVGLIGGALLMGGISAGKQGCF